MSLEAASALFDRIERDEGFTAELASLESDSPALLARIRAEGFDVTEAEIRETLVQRYGDRLSPDQLESIAAGVDMGGSFGGLSGGIP